MSAVEMRGYSVNGIVHSASAAVEGVLKLRPAIVIMDVNLEAGGNGLEVARIIRLQRSVPIIFHTASGDEAFRQQVAALAHTQVLQKLDALNEALMTASCSAG